MTYRKVIIFLIIISVIGILAAILIPEVAKWRNPVKREIKQHHDSVLVKKAEIERLITKEKTLLIRIKQDSALQALQSIQFKTKISNLERKLSQTRPIVMAQVDTLPEVKEYILTQDSVITTQAAEIDTLQAQKVKTWNEFNKIMNVSEQKFQASLDVNRNLDAIIGLQNKDNKRLKRQNTFLKIGLGIAGAGFIGVAVFKP